MNDRFKFKVWVIKDIDGCFDNEDGILKRGWLQGQCEWYQLSSNGVELMWGWEECEEPLINGRQIIIVPCTGLKDKNDKLDFEGDRVRFDNGVEGYIKHVLEGYVFVVKSIHYRMCSVDSPYHPMNNPHQIIGTIYEGN